MKSAPEALHPALGLGRARADPGGAEIVQHASDLGRQGLAGQLFFEGQGLLFLRMKDLMAVAVEGEWDPPLANHLTQEQQIALGVFLLTEDGVGNVPRRVVDRPQKSEPGTVRAEPLVTAAVHLEKHPRLGHSLTARAVTWRPPPLGTPQSRRPPDTADGGPAENNPFPLG